MENEKNKTPQSCNIDSVIQCDSKENIAELKKYLGKLCNVELCEENYGIFNILVSGENLDFWKTKENIESAILDSIPYNSNILVSKVINSNIAFWSITDSKNIV